MTEEMQVKPIKTFPLSPSCLQKVEVIIRPVYYKARETASLTHSSENTDTRSQRHRRAHIETDTETHTDTLTQTQRHSDIETRRHMDT